MLTVLQALEKQGLAVMAEFTSTDAKQDQPALFAGQPAYTEEHPSLSLHTGQAPGGMSAHGHLTAQQPVNLSNNQLPAPDVLAAHQQRLQDLQQQLEDVQGEHAQVTAERDSCKADLATQQKVTAELRDQLADQESLAARHKDRFLAAKQEMQEAAERYEAILRN